MIEQNKNGFNFQKWAVLVTYTCKGMRFGGKGPEAQSFLLRFSYDSPNKCACRECCVEEGIFSPDPLELL